MSEMELLKINIDFETALRTGSYAHEGLSGGLSIAADRLFSFICLGWLRLYSQSGLREDLINPFLSGKRPFLISDLLPVYDGEIYIPASMLLSGGQSLTDYFQEPWTSLRSVLSGEFSDKETSTQVLKMTYLFKNSMDGSKPGAFVSLLETGKSNTRLTARRRNSSREEATMPAQGLSFSAFLSSADKRITGKIENVLSFMKDEGLGGLRSSGKGKIQKICIESLDENVLQENTENGNYLLLSHCCPENSMLENLRSSAPGSNRYRVGRSGGWIYTAEGQHSGLRKPQTMHFETGSIFSIAPQGKLLDLSRGDLSCFRYGIPFTVRIPA